jgi:hypothetical protein
MNGMILHRGAKFVNWNEVAEVPTPPSTATHYPIGHAELVNLTLDTLNSYGYQITKQAHALKSNGAQYFGLFELTGKDYPANPLRGLVAAIRNSHDMSFVAGFAGGETAFICDNLALSAEYTFGRRHTLRIKDDLPVLVCEAVDSLRMVRQTTEQREDRYKTVEIGMLDADHLIMETLRRGVLPASKIGKLWKEYRHPRHPDYTQYKGTMMGMYCAVTEFFKEGSVFDLPKRSRGLHGLMDRFCMKRESNRVAAEIEADAVVNVHEVG